MSIKINDNYYVLCSNKIQRNYQNVLERIYVDKSQLVQSYKIK